MKKELNITPGPWKISKHCSTLIEGPNKRNVCSTGGYQTNFDTDQTIAENEANARAIAALPDLIEALEFVVEFGNNTEHEVVISPRIKAKHALAKVKGTQ